MSSIYHFIKYFPNDRKMMVFDFMWNESIYKRVRSIPMYVYRCYGQLQFLLHKTLGFPRYYNARPFVKLWSLYISNYRHDICRHSIIIGLNRHFQWFLMIIGVLRFARLQLLRLYICFNLLLMKALKYQGKLRSFVQLGM